MIGGSFPEREIIDGTEKLFNTTTAWSPTGEMIGKFRKMHLFDINIPDKVRKYLYLGIESQNNFKFHNSPSR